MSRWDCLCICVIVSNELCIPLELLWEDNMLTFLGALSIICVFGSIYNKFLSNFIK